MYQWLVYPYLYSAGQVEEVYNFSQDDLLTEDILILDTHAEVFVWVGQSVDSKEKQSAFEFGQVLVWQIMVLSYSNFSTIHLLHKFLQNYIDMATSLEGLSPKVPLYKVTEGNEPCFFTTFFSWDPTKATVCALMSGFLYSNCPLSFSIRFPYWFQFDHCLPCAYFCKFENSAYIVSKEFLLQEIIANKHKNERCVAFHSPLAYLIKLHISLIKLLNKCEA